ncbi:hypothetical protein ACHAW5_008348, partial [Stephanodiscus triporus]
SSSLLLLLLSFALVVVVRCDAYEDLWNKYVQAQQQEQSSSSSSSSSTSSYESTVSRRERNLDHWDVSAAAAHLGLHPVTLVPLPKRAPTTSSSSDSDVDVANAIDEYVGHDSAILFYSRRSADCHAVAPSWDAIASYLDAGSMNSNLIMALFDCERDDSHAKLCDAVGVTTYPTIVYVGCGEYHGAERGILGGFGWGMKKEGKGHRHPPPRRSVRFRGDWRYADQILDWINVMGALSRWHAIADEGGMLGGIRNGLFRLMGGGGGRGGGRGTSSRGGGKGGGGGGGGSLPVGVPPGFQTELRGGGGGVSDTVQKRKVRDLETRLNVTIREKDLYEKASLHSGYLLEGLLFPKGRTKDGEEDGKEEDDRRLHHGDPFAILSSIENGWHRNGTSLPPGSSNDEHPLILRSCVLELVVDYCSRVTTRVTNEYIRELNAIPESDPFPTLDEIEKRLLDDVKDREGYCGLIEGCVTTNFEDPSCRPLSCPFVNAAACTYVECCLEPNVQDEYGVALGLMKEGERVMDMDWSGGIKKRGDGTYGGNDASVGGWGVPAK